MKKIYYSGKVINFFKKGITLSLLILLNLAAYSNPMGENTVAGHTYTVTQEGAVECTISLSSPTANVPATAGAGHVEVSVNAPQCKWTAALRGRATWLFITEKESSRIGSHTLHYTYLANTTTTPRTEIVNVAGQLYTVTQAGATASCLYTLATPEIRIGSAASTAETRGSFSVTVQGTCSWTPVAVDEWITNVTKAQTANSDGSWTVSYSYQANYSPIGRRGTILVGDKIQEVIQAEGCSYTLAPIEARIGAEASTADNKGSFAVSIQGTDCSWMPATTDHWITQVTKAATANANGSWTVTYSYTANTSASERRGTITVGDKTHTVIQVGTGGVACSYRLSSDEISVSATAGTIGEFSVTVQGSGCTWAPVSTTGWITHLTKAASANADGAWLVTFSWLANSAIAARRGTITVGDKTFTVNQAGTGAIASCEYVLTPLEANKGAAASTPQTGGSFLVSLRQGSNCPCTPKTSDNWITNITQTSTTPTEEDVEAAWTVTYSFTANTSASERRGTIYVADQTHTVIQAGTGAAACSYTLAPVENNIGSAGSTEATMGHFTVSMQGTGCTWTPATAAGWITSLTKAATASADGSWNVSYSFAANNSTTERRGTITVGDKTHTVIQAGATASCSYTLAPVESRIGSEASTADKKGTFAVTIQGTDCTWTPAAATGWITQVSKAATANANGTWDVTYSYAANASASERRGTITVGDKTHTVIQAGTGAAACSISLPYNTSIVPVNEGSRVISVHATGADCEWTATVTQGADWLSINPGQDVMLGTTPLHYSYTTNPNSTPRTGIITVAGLTFTVTQSALVTGIEPGGGVRIFPNPANDFVTVDLSAYPIIKYASLKIVNQVGQIIYQLDTPPAQALRIPLNGFFSGLYFIFLQGEEKALVKKLIVR